MFCYDFFLHPDEGTCPIYWILNKKKHITTDLAGCQINVKNATKKATGN